MMKINSLKYNPITVDMILKIRRKRKMFDINNVKITVLRMPDAGDWMACKRRALITVGKEPVNPPDDKWKKDILRARHSPIRRLEFSILIENLPSSISVHFVRHVHAQPYVKSQRNDRQSEYDRDNAPQSAPVAMIWDFNAEEAQVIFNKRLCAQADKNTRAVAAKIRDAILAEDDIYSEVFVPFCEFYGCCKEMKPCGRETRMELLMKNNKHLVDERDKLKKEIEELKKAKETLEDDSLRSGIQELNERNKLKKEIEELKTEIRNLKDLDALNKNIIRIIKEGVEDIVCHRHEEPTSEYTERYVIRLVQEEVDRLKYKLKNSDIVDDVLIEKTRELLDENKAAKKRLNAMYGTICCPIKTISDDEKRCEDCRWYDLLPNSQFYPCNGCRTSDPRNWEPKKGGEEV